MACRIQQIQLLVGIFVFFFAKNGHSAEYGSVQIEPLFTKPFRKDGVSLIVGSKTTSTFKDVFPDIGDILDSDIKCTFVEDFDPSEYAPRIQVRKSDKYAAFTSDEKEDVALSIYFLHTGCNVWECSPKEMRYPESISTAQKYWQVENKIVDLAKIDGEEGEKIREIKYYSGVDVSMFDCWDALCLSIVETKCLVKIGDQVIQFKCRERVNIPQHRYYIPSIEKTLIPSKDSSGVESSTWHYSSSTIQDTGSSFEIGIPKPIEDAKEFGCRQSKIRTGLFPPKIYQLIELNDKRKHYAELTKMAFRNSFLIIGKKIQVCESLPNKDQIIYRVEHDIMGKIGIKKIRYGSGIEQLVSVNLPTNKEIKTIRYRETIYYDAITRKPVTFSVKSVWGEPQSGTSYYATTNRKDHDVVYRLPQKSYFSTWLNYYGFELIVGSDAPLKNQVNSNFKCTQSIYLDEYETEIKMILYDNKKFFTQITDDSYIIPYYTSQQSWECIDAELGGLSNGSRSK